MEPQKRMKPEVKEPWVAALLGDEYRQGSGSLIDTVYTDGEAKTTYYCCLGVLCDLAVKAGAEGIRLVEKDADYGPVSAFQWRDSEEWQWTSTDGTLPLPVREWAGLDSDDPYLDTQGTTAVEANDSLGWTFTDIAKSISENL